MTRPQPPDKSETVLLNEIVRGEGRIYDLSPLDSLSRSRGVGYKRELGQDHINIQQVCGVYRE